MSATLFVAQELGFWGNPKTLTFAQTVKNHPQRTGGALILMLREFFLLHGRCGVLPPNFGHLDIALGLGWEGRPAVLISAFERAGALQRKKGRWIYPGWRDTPTGYWEEQKEKERIRKASERELRQAWKESFPSEDWPGVSVAKKRLTSEDNPRPVLGLSADKTRTEGDQASKEASAPAGAPPSGPPSGGVVSSALRLAWTEANYPLGLVDPPEVERLLGALTEGEWLHFKHAVSSTYRKKNPAFVKPVEVVLKAKLYRLVKLPKPVTPKAPPSEAPATRAEPTPEAIELEKERDKQIDFFKQLNAIRERLKAQGLKGMELEGKALEELDRLQGPPRLEVVR